MEESQVKAAVEAWSERSDLEKRFSFKPSVLSEILGTIEPRPALLSKKRRPTGPPGDVLSAVKLAKTATDRKMIVLEKNKGLEASKAAMTQAYQFIEEQERERKAQELLDNLAKAEGHKPGKNFVEVVQSQSS